MYDALVGSLTDCKTEVSSMLAKLLLSIFPTSSASVMFVITRFGLVSIMFVVLKLEPTLKEAQAYVGGYVEGISFPNGDYLIVNEEGKLMGLPLNEEASKLWKDTFDNDDYITGRDDFVVGNAILIKKDALKQWAA